MIGKSRDWLYINNSKRRANRLHLWNDNYGFAVMAVWPVDGQRFKDEVLHFNKGMDWGEDFEIEKDCAYFIDAPQCGFIGFNSNRPSAEMIAHEAYHCIIHKLVKDRGVELTAAGDESIAYPLGWLVGKISLAVTKGKL